MAQQKQPARIHGCSEARSQALRSDETSRSADHTAPTRALASTVSQTLVWARILEKKTGSLQLLRSQSSSSRRMLARWYAA